jgi:hypothetical protein
VAANEDKPQFPRLLLCEGPEDQAFFGRLIANRNLPGFHIWNAGGNRNFLGALRAFEIERPRTLRQCSRILVVGDNDESPVGNFNSVREQLDKYFGAGRSPQTKRSRTTGNPSLAILMIPWDDRHGHLESLCVEAAHWADRTIGSETDHFMARLLADRWSESRRGKAWLRSNLAARCQSDPFIPLGRSFNDALHHRLIPTEHASFKQIADFLVSFAS